MHYVQRTVSSKDTTLKIPPSLSLSRQHANQSIKKFVNKPPKMPSFRAHGAISMPPINISLPNISKSPSEKRESTKHRQTSETPQKESQAMKELFPLEKKSRLLRSDSRKLESIQEQIELTKKSIQLALLQKNKLPQAQLSSKTKFQNFIKKRDKMEQKKMMRQFEWKMGREVVMNRPMMVEVESYSLPGLVQGVPKQNQDNYFLEQPWNHLGIHLFGICDGHGDYGHQVSLFIKTHYPPILATLLRTRADLEQVEQVLLTSFLRMDEKLGQSSVNDEESGSTLCVLLVDTQKHLVYSANCGDSRALLTTPVLDALPTQLTIDHKPGDIIEQLRIQKAGGKVSHNPRDKKFVDRIYFPHEDSPGLALSRSLGDRRAKEIGVVAVPEVQCFRPQSLYPGNAWVLVLASDGVWDVLDNRQVAQAVARRGGGKTLVEQSAHVWSKNTKGYYQDDISTLVLRLDS